MNTANLKRQHNDIKIIINEILKEMNGNIDENSMNISKNISKLAGVLKIHLNSEDRFLYPNLLNHADERVRNKAKHYIEEMGSVSNKFLEFHRKYNVSSKIKKSKNLFKNECRETLKVVVNRINEEDSDLYLLIN
ncbi:hemerythrin domain-containing protein [Oceanirhabdus sp. W0125-5]|uniref:hemerythrin domain-containing protein n=1 Tax=Oceanirhabdus sp. W0125-5 TaxID=2999116 RepID=UPI0022F31F6C|nr:hemerythrin domain-containing protein [Oceanirhabdus sp. W0125-5]WBW96497.1 hemerythrin domain-containing protein [Oceanirhabdus sp. W0125-5]